MMAVDQPKHIDDHSAYRKYHQVVKKSILLNKAQIDAGYPQNIFCKNAPHHDNDYIEDNKKNLKNFFKDRIPEEEITKDTFKLKTINMDPVRIFEIKRQQFQLKNQTKILLNASYLDKKRSNSYQSTRQAKGVEKISQLFCINDKTLQLKKKFANSNTNVKRFDSYSKQNHRRGTCSFVEKRSKIIKRQAYEKVFGPDISSISRTLPISENIQQIQIFDKFSQNKKLLLKSPNLSRKNSYISTMQNKRQQLSKLIKKIDDFKQKMKPVKLDYNEPVTNNNNQSKQLSRSSIRQAEFNNNSSLIKYNEIGSDELILEPSPRDERKGKVIELIKNITDVYRGQSIDNNREKITQLSDLEKLDSKFYSQLSKHKKSRMQKRMYELYKYSLPQTNEIINSKISSFNGANGVEDNKKTIKIKKAPLDSIHHLDSHNRKQSDVLTITDNGDFDHNQQIQMLQNVSYRKKPNNKQRFRTLSINLIDAVLHADIYMVKHNFIYQSFWQERVPYQMEGSYAFFKAIKLNDIECVKTFIELDLNYLYQVDSTGKTPLIYSCLHNRQKIVQYFLSNGSNIDKQCLSKKKALFYALQNKNLYIVKLLLQYGANPWSSQLCPYGRMCKQIQDERFDILFSNARKIFLGVRLQKGSNKRSQFWHKIKNKISQHKRIQF